MNKLIDALLSMHGDGTGQVSWLRVCGTLILLSILVPHVVVAIRTGQPDLALSAQELQLLAGFGLTKLVQNRQES